VESVCGAAGVPRTTLPIPGTAPTLVVDVVVVVDDDDVVVVVATTTMFPVADATIVPPISVLVSVPPRGGCRGRGGGGGF